ncbi:MAG: radical SAM protein [Candidatus Nealsonbacteria bacterium]|nr:radical SAM protein [Candidatus Nealsonbacteria bacterium]
MKTFYIEQIGCERRGLDAERVVNYLIKNGLERIASPREADYSFLFTCSFSNNIELCMKRISELNKFGNELIVCGCLPSIKLSDIRKVFKGRIIKTNELFKIEEIFPDFGYRFNDIDDSNFIIKELLDNNKTINDTLKKIKKITLLNLAKPLDYILKRYAPVHTNQSLFSIRISDGCKRNCSYCTIKKGAGELKSKPMPLILEEVDRAITEKRFKINLVSADMGAYGFDIGSSFPALLTAILNKDKRIKIDIIKDLHSLDVCNFKDEFIKLVKTKRIKRVRIGVQSGSEMILKLMRRHIDFPVLIEAIKEIKKAYPEIRLSSQIIIGFPTETEEDFKQTVKLIKDCGFDECQAFKYFENESVDSFKIEPKVPVDIIDERMKIAEKIFNKYYYDTNIDRLIGKFGIYLRRNHPSIYHRIRSEDA